MLVELDGCEIRTGSLERAAARERCPVKRLKLPGAWWHPDIVNPMLALRVLRANDWWDDFWLAAA